MRKAIKIGIFFYCLIQISYLLGIYKTPSDKDLYIPMPIDTTKKPNGDTAIRYRQDLTPIQERKGKKPIDVNTE